MTYFTYYDKSFEQVESGYTERFRVFTLETNVYDAASKQLVFSMQSEIIEPSQPRHAIEDQIRLTINRLRANNLIGN